MTNRNAFPTYDALSEADRRTVDAIHTEGRIDWRQCEDSGDGETFSRLLLNVLAICKPADDLATVADALADALDIEVFRSDCNAIVDVTFAVGGPTIVGRYETADAVFTVTASWGADRVVARFDPYAAITEAVAELIDC